MSFKIACILLGSTLFWGTISGCHKSGWHKMFMLAGRKSPQGNPQSMIDRADELRKQGKYFEAQSILLQALPRANKNPYAHYLMGVTYIHLSKPDEALREFYNTWRLDPNAQYVHLELGYTYLQLSKFSNAEHEFDASIRFRPGFWGYEGIGRAYMGEDKNKEALAAFRQALKYPAPAPDQNRVNGFMKKLEKSGLYPP